MGEEGEYDQWEKTRKEGDPPPPSLTWTRYLDNGFAPHQEFQVRLLDFFLGFFGKCVSFALLLTIWLLIIPSFSFRLASRLGFFALNLLVHYPFSFLPITLLTSWSLFRSPKQKVCASPHWAIGCTGTSRMRRLRDVYQSWTPSRNPMRDPAWVCPLAASDRGL